MSKSSSEIVNGVTVCWLPYQESPFVKGWVETSEGRRDVWLQNDGSWTYDQDSAGNSLAYSADLYQYRMIPKSVSGSSDLPRVPFGG